LSFCHSHLVDSSDGKVLLGSHRNRVGTSVWRCVGFRHRIGVQMRFGVHMSIMALLSAIETSPLSWILRGVWSYLQPLYVLLASSRSLKITRVLDHMMLQSYIALLGLMGPLLELLLDNRCGRVGTVVGSWGVYCCHFRAVSWIGTNVSKVTLLSTVVALPIGWSSCHILVALGWGR
jgi:hypothetical protein